MSSKHTSRGKTKLLSKMCSREKANNGKSAYSPAFEEALNIWVLDKHQHGFLWTPIFILLQALHMAKKVLTGPTKFNVSSGSCTRLMNNDDFCIQQKTEILQKLLAELKRKS